MDNEIWKMVPGYEGLYMASNLGRVRSLVGRWGNGRVLKPQKTTIYLKVSLSKNNRVTQIAVAKVVAMTFLGEGHKLRVCHNNNNPLDNRLENIRYDTQRGNCADKKRHGTHQRGDTHPSHILTESDVLKIRSDKRKKREIAAEYGVTRQCVTLVQRKKNWAYLD